MTTEFRVKRIERFIVTRHEVSESGCTGSNRQIGNPFDNADTAYEVAYALARQEAEMKGYGPGDMRLIYPRHPNEVASRLSSPIVNNPSPDPSTLAAY